MPRCGAGSPTSSHANSTPGRSGGASACGSRWLAGRSTGRSCDGAALDAARTSLAQERASPKSVAAAVVVTAASSRREFLSRRAASHRATWTTDVFVQLLQFLAGLANCRAPAPSAFGGSWPPCWPSGRSAARSSASNPRRYDSSQIGPGEQERQQQHREHAQGQQQPLPEPPAAGGARGPPGAGTAPSRSAPSASSAATAGGSQRQRHRQAGRQEPRLNEAQPPIGSFLQ